MDWDIVIERNRERLRGILATLIAKAGLAGAGTASPSPLWGGVRGTLPRHLHRAIMRLLRPAESAARRLIVVAARDLVLPPPRPCKPRPRPMSIFVRPGEARTGIVLPHGVKPSDILPVLAKPRPYPRSLALPLSDTLRGLPRRHRPPARAMPRIWASGCGEPDRPPSRRPPMPGDPIDATRIALRLRAIGRALDDLPGHARRFARWRARQDAAIQDIRHAFGEQDLRHDASEPLRPAWLPRRLSPLRPGRPPGGNRRSKHEVHEVLKDLQYFASRALERRDTS